MAARALTAGEKVLLALAPEALRARGLPTRRDEAWKWSDLRAAVDETMAASARLAGGDARAVESALAEGDMIAALAAATGGTDAVRVSAGEKLVRVDRIAADGFAARGVILTLEPGADVFRIVLQEGGAGVALDTAAVQVGAGARYRQFVLAEGGKLARVETRVEAGADADVRLDGLYLAGAGRHADLTSRVRHAAPGGVTRQLVKGAARKGGRGVFQGRLEVARGAQKTDARQYHHGLLLDEGAEIYAKPELEIYADDVQCAHGNTAGALDEAALFYMRARGVPERAARAMLTEAFLLEALPEDLPAAARGEAEARARAWLEAGA